MRNELVELGRIAGETVREHFRNLDGKVQVKGRNDYVSYVDRRVEDLLITRIRGRHPEHGIVAEETADRIDAAATRGPTWIIDPIDGTTNFVRGIAHFAISIAFCDADLDPLVGVVYDPVADEMFVGERGAGAWLGGERIATSPCTRLADALLASALPFKHRESIRDVGAVLLDLQERCDDHRRRGSAALDLAHLACGRVDGYWELGISAWDVAAGELLVRAAGGRATGFDGAAADLGARRSICAAASAELHGELLAAVAPLHGWLDRAPFRADPAG